MSQLHEKLIGCIERSGKSVRAVALEASVPYSRLHSALKNTRTISFEDVVALSKALEVPLQEFVASQDEECQPANFSSYRILEDAISLPKPELFRQTGRVSLEDFLDWWFLHSGRLENYDAFRDELDLFYEPPSDAKRILPVQSGARSLASISFEVEAADHLTQTLEGFSAQFNRSLVKAHMQALRCGEPVLTHPTIDVALPNGKRVQKTYRRILAPVQNSQGTRFIANFTKDIAAETAFSSAR